MRGYVQFALNTEDSLQAAQLGPNAWEEPPPQAKTDQNDGALAVVQCELKRIFNRTGLIKGSTQQGYQSRMVADQWWECMQLGPKSRS